MDEIQSHKEWYGALFMISTNLVALVPIVLSFKLELWYIGIQILLSMVFSTIYHTCDSTGFCLFGYSLLVWRTMDYIYAFMQIVIVFIFMVDFESTHTSPNNFVRQRWAVITQQLFGAIVVLVIMADPFSRDAAYVIIAVGSMTVYLKFVFLDRGDIPINNRFEAKFVITGVLLFGIGVGLFSIEGTVVYWLFHSLWHVAAYLGQYFLILGGSKHYKGWHHIIRFCGLQNRPSTSRCEGIGCFTQKDFEDVI